MVKLVSTGGKEASHNYSLELSSLMKKVKAYIDPVQAVPLTKRGKSFLAKPHSVR